MLLRVLTFQLLATVAALRMVLPVYGLKGDSGCGYLLCINATLHDDVVTYELTALYDPFGWIAIGFGRQMNGSQMVIMWQNEDGSATLSQRRGMGHYEPLPVEYPSRKATIVAPRITSWHPTNATKLAFSMPANKTLLASSRPIEQLIWAYSLVRPDKPSWSILTQHYSAGVFRLDFSKDVLNVPDDSGNIPRPTIDHTDAMDNFGPLRGHEKIIIAHGVLASIGFLVLLPAGSLVARWGRTLTPKWFKMHQALMLIAMPVITLGWILGPIAVMGRQATHLFDAHQICGVLLAALYYLQVTLGRYIHRKRAQAIPNSSSHPPSNILHIVLGLTIIILAFLQTRSGMNEWQIATGRTHVAQWCHDLWNIWVVIIPIAYLAGMIMLPRQLYQEKAGTENYLSLSVTPPGSHVVFDSSGGEEYHKTIGRMGHSTESIELTRETSELESNEPLLNSHRR